MSISCLVIGVVFQSSLNALLLILSDVELYLGPTSDHWKVSGASIMKQVD